MISQMPHLNKWQYHKNLATEVAKNMLTSEYIKIAKRGERMSRCSERITYQYCQDCGAIHLSRVWLCRDRLCPVCNWRLATKRYAEMMQIATAEELQAYNVSVITLTMRNVPLDNLRNALTQMSKAWDRLCKRRTYKRLIIGYAKHTEITNKDTNDTYHPHLHVLVIVPQYAMIEHQQLCWDWADCLDVNYRPYVDIRRAYTQTPNGKKDWDNIAGAIIEAFKYSVKSEDIATLSPNNLTQLAEQVAGFQFITYGGLFRMLRKKYGITSPDRTEVVNDAIIACPQCGSTALAYDLYKWAFGRYLIDNDRDFSTM